MCGVCDGANFCQSVSFEEVSGRFVQSEPVGKARYFDIKTERNQCLSLPGSFWASLQDDREHDGSRNGPRYFLDIALGIVDAIVGGFLYSQIFGGEGVTGVNIGSIIVSIVGAIIVLWIFHAVAGRRTT